MKMCRFSLIRPAGVRALALVFMSVAFAPAQNTQFLFDALGNLATQTAATPAAPQILHQPQDQIAAPGSPASFSVVAANTAGLTYQWRFHGTNLPGATGDSLLITNVSSVHAGPYSVTLANSSGSAVSAPATLLLDSDRDSLPDTWEQTFFSGLGQWPTGDFDADGVSNADEFFDGTDPTDGASLLYRLTLLSDGGQVELIPGSLKYTNGSVVTLIATATLPEIFHGWTGAITARTNQISLVMTNHKTMFAHFQPVVLTWAGTSSSWHEPTNWNPTLVPTAVDNVRILTSPTISINESAECNELLFTGGTLSGSGLLRIHSNAVWSAGTMIGNGRTVIEPSATLTINAGGSVTLNSRVLENAGTILWSGVGSIFLANAVITNRSGALFQANNNASLSFNGGVNRFDNAGTFRKSSTGTTTVSPNVSFNNYHTVELQAGTLTLVGGGVNQGTLTAATNTTVTLSGGTFTSSGPIAGAGHLTISGATANLSGPVNLTGNHTFSAGTANLTGAYFCTNNTLTISGGTANFNGSGLIQPNTLTLSSGTLSGNQLVTPLTAMNWTGGIMSGSGRTVIPPGVTLTINAGGSVTLNTRVLENAGTILWSGVGSIFLANAVITNRNGALFQANNNASLSFNGGVNRFDNAGTFRKSSTGTTTVSPNVSFNNYHTVELQAGTLTLVGGGVNQGTLTAATNTTVTLSGGTFTSSGPIAGAGHLTISGATANLSGPANLTGNHTFSAGTANLTGAYFCTNNTLTISGGAANFNGTGLVQPNTLTFSGGTLSGNQLVTPLTAMNWTGGIMSGSGRTVIPPGVTLTINAPGSVTLNTRVLENAGTTLWSGVGSIFMANAVITNRSGALFQANNNASFSFNGGVNRFDNAGTFRKSSTGTTTASPNVSFNNYHTVELQAGTLTLNGGYTSRSNSMLTCSIGGTTAGSSYARLQVPGAITLNGLLSVSLTNGFIPAINNTFTLLTASSRNGAFGNFAYPSNAVTMLLSNTANSVIVTVTAVAPAQPVLLPPELIGSDVKLTWTSVSNINYRLEFNPDLSPSNWTALPGDVMGVSNTASKLDPLTTSNRLYRVRVVP